MRRHPLLLVSLLLLAPLCVQAGLKPGDFVTQGPTTAKKIALTFDDGPGPHTDQYIALLDRYHVKATFFMLAEQVTYRPQVAKEIQEKGHEVACHTYNHLNYLVIYRGNTKKYPNTPDGIAKATAETREALVADMKKSRGIIEKATGVKLNILRMPHGVDRPWVKDAARESGFILANWTFGQDWLTSPEPALEKGYLKALKPGAIFLLHDGGNKREKSLQITEALIKEAQSKGYEIVPLSDLLGIKDNPKL